MRKLTEMIDRKFNTEHSKKIFMSAVCFCTMILFMILLIALTPVTGFGVAAAISVFGFIISIAFLFAVTGE